MAPMKQLSVLDTDEPVTTGTIKGGSGQLFRLCSGQRMDIIQTAGLQETLHSISHQMYDI